MSDRYELLGINHKLIWNFRDIGHTIRHLSEGKGSQKRILIVLNEAGVITQRELTERLGIQPGSASEVVGKLEAAGLLNRTPNEIDHRTADLCLTDAGKLAAEDAYSQREERHRQMFSCLSGAEKETLLLLLEKVNTAWDRQYREAFMDQKDSNYRKGCGRHRRI